jgi:hypothetical protein
LAWCAGDLDGHCDGLCRPVVSWVITDGGRLPE